MENREGRREKEKGSKPDDQINSLLSSALSAANIAFFDCLSSSISLDFQ